MTLFKILRCAAVTGPPMSTDPESAPRQKSGKDPSLPGSQRLLAIHNYLGLSFPLWGIECHHYPGMGHAFFSFSLSNTLPDPA